MANFRVYQFNHPETWATHLEDLQFWLDSKGNISDDQKRGLLMETLDADTKRSLKDWIAPRQIREVPYKDLIIKLDEKITPEVNWLVSYSKVGRRNQQNGETGAQFLSALRATAASCGFRDATSRVVLAQFVLGLRDLQLKSKLLNMHATLTTTEALQIVTSEETARVNVVEACGLGTQEIHGMTADASIGDILHIGKPSYRYSDRRGAKRSATTEDKVCYRCGDLGHGARTYPKPWRQFRCEFCSKYGHLAKVCRSAGKVCANEPTPSKSQNCKPPAAVPTNAHHVSSDDYPDTLYMISAANSAPDCDEVLMAPLTVTVRLNGTPVRFEVDCGASRTLISSSTFRRTFPVESRPTLHDSNIALCAWGQNDSLHVAGRFFANVSFKNVSKVLPMFVSDREGPSLLGRNWFQPLGISVQGVYSISSDTPSPRPTVDQNAPIDYTLFPAVSGVGTGCYAGPPLRLDLDPDVRPVYQRARPVPFALTTQVEDAIQHNIDEGIWMPLTYAGPWATALVIVKMKQGTVRLCAAYRGTVNRALAADSYQTLTVDAVLARLGTGNRVFAEIDLKDAGLRVNANKCTWEARSIVVLGFLLDADGIRPLPERVRAIKDAPPPSSLKELQHLLGLISFYGRFFPSKTTALEPLHRLLDRGAPWHWTPDHQRALDTVKNMLSSYQVLTHYSLSLPIVVSVDASPVGLGAVLSHKVYQTPGRSMERPIMYASRTLSESERRFSQIEREALGVIFGVRKFESYVAHRRFSIITDCKPLLGIFKPGAPIPAHASPRLVRWCLYLGGFDCELVHRAGSSIAHVDFLSRMPLPDCANDEEVAPAGIHLLETNSLDALSHTDIAEATSNDPLLSRVMRWTQSGWPTSFPDDLKTFHNKDERSIIRGCLIWHDRVVIPTSLRPQVLRIVHATHMGETYSKTVARSIDWWPGIDSDIRDTVRFVDASPVNFLPMLPVVPW